MTSLQSARRRVSFQPEVRVYIVSRTSSPEPGSGQEMRLAADEAWQTGAYGISTLNNGAPHFTPDGPPMQAAYPSFSMPPMPPTPFLAPVELPPTPPQVMGGLGLGLAQLPLPTGTSSTVPTLGPEPAVSRGSEPLPQPLPVVWRLEQRWDVRACGLPLDLPADEPIPALCGVPAVVLRFTPYPLFAPFAHTLAVAPNDEAKFVVTVGDLARAVLQALRAPREQGRTTDEQRAVLSEAQRCRRGERPPVDRKLDMWGPGGMYLRHLVSLSSAGPGEGLRREFAVQFQLIV